MAATTKIWLNGSAPSCEDDDLNGFKEENNNLILGSGQALNVADRQQTHKAVAVYASSGDFYTDSGVANAYVLSPVAPRIAPPTLVLGQRISFVAGATNTGPSTVNVGGTVVVPVVASNGSPLPSGAVIAGRRVDARFNGVSFALLPENVLYLYPTKAAAKTVAPTPSEVVWMDGSMWEGVTGAPLLTYSDNATSPAFGTIIVPTGGGGSAALLRRYYGAVNAYWFGAAGDGVTNDRLALFEADAVGEVELTAGTYFVNSNLTFTNKVTFHPNAVLSVATGVTVTFNAGLSAGVFRIFSLNGTGTVVFDPSFVSHGYAEWWGAITDDGSAPVATANTLAINAALAALPKIEAMPADYFVDGTIKHQRAHCWFMGAGSNYDSVYGTRATRLLVTGGSTNTLQVGPDANPGSIAQFTLGLKLTGMHVARTVAPVIASGCRSILVQFTTKAHFEDVQAHESMVSWEFNGTVSTRAYNCMAKRSSAGTGAGTDSWKGFYINGNSGIAAGGNASLYITYSNADDTRGVVTDGNGFYLDNDFTDCFLGWCESVSCTNGIVVSGNSGVGVDLGNTDLHIHHCVMDAFVGFGILIQNLAEAASIEIDGVYLGPATGATHALLVQNSPASVHVSGGQLVMGATTTTTPMGVLSSSGVRMAGTQILETLTNDCVVLTDSDNCNIQPIIKNRSNAAGAAVKLTGTCTANYVAPTVLGKASGVAFGIQVIGVADGRNEYNCTGIDSATVNGGSGNKLVRNGVQIVATGLTGTNLASGVMT